MSNILVKSNNKFYYKISEPWTISSYNTVLINGRVPDESPVKSSWYITDERPKTATLVQSTREYTDWSIKEEYKHLNLPISVDKFEEDDEGDLPSESMFYTHNFVEKEVKETKDIEWDTEIDETVSEPVLFTAIGDSSWGNDKLIKISPAASLVDSLIYPDIALPAKACALTGDQLYKIIRHHVKSNIDGRHAKITSDYNFCFGVSKLLAITPESRTYDARTGRQRTPRYKTYVISNREVSVFEMTPPSENYKGYTPVQGIKASSHAELKKKLDLMLEELMNVINKPLESCKTCDGTGVVDPERAKING